MSEKASISACLPSFAVHPDEWNLKRAIACSLDVRALSDDYGYRAGCLVAGLSVALVAELRAVLDTEAVLRVALRLCRLPKWVGGGWLSL